MIRKRNFNGYYAAQERIFDLREVERMEKVWRRNGDGNERSGD